MSGFVQIDEIAKYFSVSVSTIRAWVRQGNIPANAYIKVGNTYRFSIPMTVEALTGLNQEADTTQPNEATEEVAEEMSDAPEEVLDVAPQEGSDDFGLDDLDDDL